jgi:hypothetical protein
MRTDRDVRKASPASWRWFALPARVGRSPPKADGHVEHAMNDVSNKASLQRGARTSSITASAAIPPSTRATTASRRTSA